MEDRYSLSFSLLQNAAVTELSDGGVLFEPEKVNEGDNHDTAPQATCFLSDAPGIYAPDDVA